MSYNYHCYFIYAIWWNNGTINSSRGKRNKGQLLMLLWRKEKTPLPAGAGSALQTACWHGKLTWIQTVNLSHQSHSEGSWLEQFLAKYFFDQNMLFLSKLERFTEISISEKFSKGRSLRPGPDRCITGKERNREGAFFHKIPSCEMLRSPCLCSNDAEKYFKSSKVVANAVTLVGSALKSHCWLCVPALSIAELAGR